MISEKIIVICDKHKVFFQPAAICTDYVRVRMRVTQTSFGSQRFIAGQSARSMCEVCVMGEIRICKRPMPVTASQQKMQYYEEIVDYI